MSDNPRNTTATVVKRALDFIRVLAFVALLGVARVRDRSIYRACVQLRHLGC